MKRNSKNKSFVFSSLVALLNAIILISCNSGGNNNGGFPQETPTLPVATVQSGTATGITKFTGSVEGISNVVILPQVSGYLKSIHVDEGQFVQKGQLLFKIDDSPYKEQYANAKAALASAEANLLNAQINVDKQKPLVEGKVVSDITLQSAKASKASAEAMVLQAKAAVESARINLNFCTITAPVSGYVGSIPNKLGSLVSPQIVQPLTTVSDVSSIYVYFSMGEDDYIKFQKAYPGANIAEKIKNSPAVQLQISDGSIFDHEGKIETVEGQFNSNTASIRFRATFPNPGGVLRTGNTGVILIPKKEDNATMIPISATTDLQDKIFVWKVDKENKVHQTILTILDKSGQYYIVSGIEPGETIVSSGFDRLVENTVIKPEKK